MPPVQRVSPYLVNIKPTVQTLDTPRRISLDIINFLRPLNEHDQLPRPQMDPIRPQHWFVDDHSQSLTYLSLVVIALVILVFSFWLGFIVVYIRRKDERYQADLKAEDEHEQLPLYADERLPAYRDIESGLSELDGGTDVIAEKC